MTQEYTRLHYQDAAVMWDGITWHLTGPTEQFKGIAACGEGRGALGMLVGATSALHMMSCPACRATPQWRDVLLGLRGWVDQQLEARL